MSSSEPFESLTAHNGPQNAVDDRNDEDSLEIDNAIVDGLSLFYYFVDQISDVVHHLILDGHFAEIHFSHAARRIVNRRCSRQNSPSVKTTSTYPFIVFE
jgi:hypothetical protein